MKYALAEMKDAGIEEMALGIELENVLLEAGLRDILVDLDGLFVLLVHHQLQRFLVLSFENRRITLVDFRRTIAVAIQRLKRLNR